MKTISECLGHYSPDFTSKVYVVTKNLSAYDISEAIEEYVSANHLLPEDYDPKILFLPDDSIYKKWFFIKQALPLKQIILMRRIMQLLHCAPFLLSHEQLIPVRLSFYQVLNVFLQKQTIFTKIIHIIIRNIYFLQNKTTIFRHIYDEDNTFSCLGSLPQITLKHFVLYNFSGGFYEPNRRRIFIT